MVRQGGSWLIVTRRPAAVPARPVVEDVRPRVDDGRYPAKAIVGDALIVTADAFVDGHDLLRVDVIHRASDEVNWNRRPMRPLGNDRWSGSFVPAECGGHQFFVQARVDHFATWLRDLRAWIAAGQDVAVEALVGAEMLREAVSRARGRERKKLAAFAEAIAVGDPRELGELGDEELATLVFRHTEGPLTNSATFDVTVERVRARFSTWYELFPRSLAARKGRHGTLLDVVAKLEDLVALGIDVLYLPPIHPIGLTARKGRNGAVKAKRADVGSPWAIGSTDGGHTAIHPDLGSLADLRQLVESASEHGIEVALDMAFQCSPDHPWVTEHPAWFKHRPDGSIRFAENPPKRYEDIYPLDFDSDEWRELWDALRAVFVFWIDQGVTIFRVDNPHTKPFAFWEWVIPSIQAEYGDVVFLAEAFSRPKIMKRLAKIGFTQSYTYFAWRTHKWELEQYLTELTATEVAAYFRPNFWPNTPDILTEQLQRGNRQLFITRVLLAGTLAASYGIYGPAYELMERAPRNEGSEEYLDSEKYQIRQRDRDQPASIAPFISRLNAIRHENVALQHNSSLVFHWIDNEKMLAYSKTSAGVAASSHDAGDLALAPILVFASLDAKHRQSGWVELDLLAFGLGDNEPFVVHDLLSDVRYEWKGNRNFVILDPAKTPAHIFRIEPVSAKSERTKR
jgi:starch synthase (maltosyl-transferring)